MTIRKDRVIPISDSQTTYTEDDESMVEDRYSSHRMDSLLMPRAAAHYGVKVTALSDRT